jgi:hypothetical protein
MNAGMPMASGAGHDMAFLAQVARRRGYNRSLSR